MWTAAKTAAEPNTAAAHGSLEPLREQSNVGQRTFSFIFETLIGQNLLGQLESVPGLAESWKRIDERTGAGRSATSAVIGPAKPGSRVETRTPGVRRPRAAAPKPAPAPVAPAEVAASIDAIKDSGLDLEKEDREQIGVCVGSGIGGLPLIEETHGAVAAGGPRTSTQPLNRIHYVVRLGKKRIAQFLRPVQSFVHRSQDLRERNQ